MIKNCISIISLSFILILSACKTGPGTKVEITDYNFMYPDGSVILPGMLQEISGLTFIDSTILACVQDELGILFFYDLTKSKINNQISFFTNGDYEGIARAGDTLYVLRSDGTIFEVSDFKSSDIIVTSYPTDIPSKDNEGLCYDDKGNMLLIACKESTGKGDLSKSKRYIFGFDLISKSLIKDPVFSYDLKQLKEFAVNNNIYLPLKERKQGSPPEPDLKFSPSAIGIHPLTKKIYIISAEDYLLTVFDTIGNIDKMVKLNSGLFNQPEGITFLENGDIIISNEGQGKGPGTLRRLNYHPTQN